MQIRALAYVGIEVSDLEAWASFATEFLGMPAGRPSEGRLLLRMDERSYRFDVRHGEADRLLWLGWEVGSARDLADAERELNAAGVETARGTPEAAKERGIVDFIH